MKERSKSPSRTPYDASEGTARDRDTISDDLAASLDMYKGRIDGEINGMFGRSFFTLVVRDKRLIVSVACMQAVSA